MFFVVSVLFVVVFAFGIQWLLAEQANRLYPALIISVPDGTEDSDVFETWVEEHGYVYDGQAYRKGRGLITSYTKLEFLDTDTLQITEVANLLIAHIGFAIDAPIMLFKPVRKMKIKKINQLLTDLDCPPIGIDQARVSFKK